MSHGKKERSKGLARLLAQATRFESGLNKVEEKLEKWGARNEENVTLGTSALIERLISSGFKKPRAAGVRKASEPEFTEGQSVVLTDGACEKVMDLYGFDVRPTGLTVVKVSREGTAANSPRVIVVSDDAGNRFSVKPSQIAGRKVRAAKAA